MCGIQFQLYLIIKNRTGIINKDNQLNFLVPIFASFINISWKILRIEGNVVSLHCFLAYILFINTLNIRKNAFEF